MTSGRTECAFAVLALFCVLAIFFFPALQGPYPAVHGPVTALLSLRTAARLRLAIVRNGLQSICSRLRRARQSFLPVTWMVFRSLPFETSTSSAVSAAILRC